MKKLKKRIIMKLLVPLPILFGFGTISYAKSKSSPTTEITRSLYQKNQGKGQPEEKSIFQSSEWAQKHNQNVLKQRSLKKKYQNAKALEEKLLANPKTRQQVLKRKQRQAKEQELFRKQIRENNLNVRQKNEAKKLMDQTVFKNEFFDHFLSTLNQPSLPLPSTLANSWDNYLEYTNSISENSLSFQNVNDFKESNVQKILGNDFPLFNQMQTLKQIQEWRRTESFLLLMGASTLPFAKSTIEKNFVQKLLRLKGGFTNPLDAFSKAKSAWDMVNKVLDQQKQKEKKKEEDNNIFTFLKHFALTQPVALAFALTAIFLINKMEEQRKRSNLRRWPWEKQSPPLVTIPNINITKKKEPTIMERLEQIMLYFFHHPAQLIVLTFVLYNRQAIWKLLSKANDKEAFVKEAFQTINESREALVNSYDKSTKFLKDYSERFYGTIQNFAKRDAENLVQSASPNKQKNLIFGGLLGADNFTLDEPFIS